MAGYADELSLKLSAHDEMSAKLRAVKKELTSTGREMNAARKEFENTGAPEAAKEYKRLRDEYERLLTTQKELRTATKAASNELERAKNKATAHIGVAQRLGHAWMRTANVFRNNVVAGISAVGVALAGRQAIKAYGEAEKMQMSLQFAYSKFPRMADVSIDKMRELNTELMNRTGADDDALAAAEANLAMFRLTGTEISKLIPLVNDYAITTGQEVPDAAKTIGKALLGNARALKSIGVDYKVTGDRATDTARIMEILERKVGGAGDAFGQTAEGGLAIANENFSNLQETVGQTLVPALTATISIVRPLSEWFQKLPEPVRLAGVALVAVSVAALILTTRIANMAAAAKLAGYSFSGMGRKAIGLGGALTVAGAAVAVWATSQANAKAAAEDLAGSLDAVTGAATEVTRQKIGEEFLKNFSAEDLAKTPFTLREIVDAAAAGGPVMEALKAKVKGWADEQKRGLQALNPLHNAWVTALENSVRAADRDAAAGRELAAATRLAGQTAGTATPQYNALAAAQDRAAAASTALDTALGRLDRHIARRQAVASYQDALAAFKKDPSMASGLALESAMTTAAKAFKDPKRQAEFTKGAIEDIRGAVTDSALSAGVKAQLKTPLRESYQEAMKLLGALQQVAALVATGAVAGIAGTGGVTNAGANAVKRAGGGAIWGAGTATSDSIPVAASNGEYMLKTASARAIGYDTLDWVNRYGRLPAAPLPVVTGPPIVLPPGPGTGRDAPLIGSQTNIINGQVDMDATLARAAREQQRSADTERRTRFAGTR